MESALAIIMALVTYLSTLTTAIPQFKTMIKTGDINLAWIVMDSEISTVDYDTYYKYYNEKFVQPFENDDPKDFPDVTEKYQKMLDENLEIAREWKRSPGQGQVNFFNSVRDHGIWDYKRYDRHVEIAAEWGIPTESRFTVYGVVMNWEALGNINFAFTGGAVGFTPTTILTGGGLVNVKNNNSTWEKIPYYFDDKDDNSWINFGIGLYAMCDTLYLDNAEFIDTFFEIADPRFVGGVYLLYKDIEKMQAENASKAA